MINSTQLTKPEINKLVALGDLISASIEFKNKMVGKTFMYVFDNRYIEVNYRIDNFKHLTGVASTLTPNEFYKNCVNRTISLNQINFTTRHPYRLAKNKLKHLKNFYNAVTSECFMQEGITTDSGTYKFGTTDMNFSLLLVEDIDSSIGIKRSNYYLAKSLRDKDCFDKSKTVYPVTHIFVKDNKDGRYSKALYIDKNNKSHIPQEAKDKLEDNILTLLD